MSLVAWPLNEREAGVELVLIETSLPFLYVNEAVLMLIICSEVSIKTRVVYHLPQKSGNFGWNVNGKTIFFFPNGNFHGKMGILKGSPKFPNGISE